MNEQTQLILFALANKWLEKNPERLLPQEQKKFKADLMEYIYLNNKTMSDEVFDFLCDLKIIKSPNRHLNFAKYLTKKYDDLTDYFILDVGAGRMCHLSEILAKSGSKVIAMDPKIRLTRLEAKEKRIQEIRKELFQCDKFAKIQSPTDISSFDLVVGLEPCMATEHIIRQGLTHDKPFDVLLCETAHNSLTGKEFKSTEQWINYLMSISKEIKDVTYNGSTILTNLKSQPPKQEKLRDYEEDEFYL